MKVYKFRGGKGLFEEVNGNLESIFERDINTIVNNQIYLPTVDQLNDPTEGFYNDDVIASLFDHYGKHATDLKKQYDGLISTFKTYGIYSLSKNVTNELLWTYYGGAHYGFAIEYDLDKMNKSLNYNIYYPHLHSINVEYSESIPKADISVLQRIDASNMLKIYLGTKSLSWKHEDEHRIITATSKLFDIDYKTITGIYFGCRMNATEIDYIMKKLKGRRLKYYKMESLKNTYKFAPKEIQDTYINTPKYIAKKPLPQIDKYYFTLDYLGGKAYQFKDKLIEAVEVVRAEPLITGISHPHIDIKSGMPHFLIVAYTNNKNTPIKKFQFKLNSYGNIVEDSTN